MPLSPASQTKPEPEKAVALEKSNSAASMPPAAVAQAARPLPAVPQVSKDSGAVGLSDPFGGALKCIEAVEDAVIGRLKSYEDELNLLRANVDKASHEYTQMARRWMDVTIALNEKTKAVDSTQRKLDAILASLMETHAEKAKSLGRTESATPAVRSGVLSVQRLDADKLQAKVNSRARQIELLEEQVTSERRAAQQRIEELDAELERERLQHALAADNSFGRAA